jgi:hypothetical protein
MKSTPVLVPDGLFDATAITDKFRKESGKIDKEIARLVVETLGSYPGRAR